MRKTALLPIVLALSLLAGALGCAFGEFRPDDPFKRQYTLEEQSKRYTDLVRWSKFDEAALFVDSESRSEFLAAMPDFAEVRFTDWDAAPWELDEEKRTTTIEVTYKGYSMSSPVVISVQETQVWTRSGRGNSWSVRSSFSGLDRLAGS